MDRLAALVALVTLLDCNARMSAETPTRPAPGSVALAPTAELGRTNPTPPSAPVPREEAERPGARGSSDTEILDGVGSGPSASDAPSRFVAWTTEGGATVTHWIEATAGGHRTVEERHGRWIEVDGSQWEIRVEPVILTLPDCASLLEGTPSDDTLTGRGERVVAKRTLPDGSGDREEQVTIFEPRTDATGVEAKVVGVHLVGDLLLVETNTWLDTCGAFPDETHETTAFSLSAWRPVDTGMEQRAAAREVLRRAHAALDAPSEPIHLGVGAVRPRWDRSGALVADYVVTVTPAPEDLAPWSAAVGQLTITSPVLPPAWAPVPATIADYARAVGAEKISGFAPTVTARDGEV